MPAAIESHTFSPPTRPDRLLAERDVIERLAIGRSTWWQHVKAGRAPAGVLLGPKTRRWRESEIDAFIDSLSQ